MKMKNLTTFRGILILLSLLLMVAASGCIFSPDPDPDPVTPVDPSLPAAITEDKLMANFKVIYEEMIIDEFRKMLHTDYRTILLEGTIQDWGWETGATFDRDDEIAIHEHMFGGSPGTDHEGNGIHPLDRIEVTLFERMGGWTTVSNEDLDFPGTRKAVYQVKIFFHDNTGNHKFEVTQEVIFYAQAVQDGGRTIFQLRGQRGIES